MQRKANFRRPGIRLRVARMAKAAKAGAGALSAVLLALASCSRPAAVGPPEPGAIAPLDAPPLAADSVRTTIVAPGVAYRYYWMREGPWAVHVLDIDPAHCWTLGADKGGDGAVGRATTSGIVARRLGGGMRIAGGVNADFFLFAPPGLPAGAHIDDGTVISGPGTRPVLLVDSGGRIAIGSLRATGWVAGAAFGAELEGWNRPIRDGLALFDESWGSATDSAPGMLEVILSAMPRGVVLGIDTAATGVAIPPYGAVLVLGPRAPRVTRLELAALRAGADSLSVAVAIAPMHPREAVAGFPVLLRDGVETANLDSAGGSRFGPVRHPRTAVGIADGGRRVFLVVVDGRQAPHSDGMTLRELAGLMLELGSEDALNLDGGGSTTMVVADGSPDGVRVVNRPSDPSGERAVGNALLVERCTTREGRSGQGG